MSPQARRVLADARHIEDATPRHRPTGRLQERGACDIRCPKHTRRNLCAGLESSLPFKAMRTAIERQRFHFRTMEQLHQPWYTGSPSHRYEGQPLAFDLSPATVSERETAERARCICIILSEVREMMARAQATGAAAKVPSLAALAAHYEAELNRLAIGSETVLCPGRSRVTR